MGTGVSLEVSRCLIKLFGEREGSSVFSAGLNWEDAGLGLLAALCYHLQPENKSNMENAKPRGEGRSGNDGDLDAYISVTCYPRTFQLQTNILYFPLNTLFLFLKLCWMVFSVIVNWNNYFQFFPEAPARNSHSALISFLPNWSLDDQFLPVLLPKGLASWSSSLITI